MELLVILGFLILLFAICMIGANISNNNKRRRLFIRKKEDLNKQLANKSKKSISASMGRYSNWIK